MTLTVLFAWALCGLVVGFLARLLLPGRQSMGLVMTMVLGIVGAIVGGFLYTIIQGGAPAEPFSLSGNAWQGWIVSIIGAIAVLLLYGTLYPRRWWQ